MENNIITSTEGFSIENLNPQIATIYKKYEDQVYTGFNNNIVVLDFGDKNSGDICTCSMRFTGVITITGASASCGCTSPAFVKQEDGSTIVTVMYDPYKIARNVSKGVTLATNKGTIRFNLIMNTK